MSRSALSIEQHLLWMLCYVEVLQRMATVAASSRDVPLFGQYAEFRSLAINFGFDIQAHALAIRSVLSPELLRKEAPWP